jgi:serine protease Do
MLPPFAAPTDTMLPTDTPAPSATVVLPSTATPRDTATPAQPTDTETTAAAEPSSSAVADSSPSAATPGGGPASGTATPVTTGSATASAGTLSVEQVVRQSLPSILRVTGNIANNQQSTGTGFVISAGAGFAYVVTNDHVISGATGVTLSNRANADLPAVKIQEDSADDLAVIEIAQPAKRLPPLVWGDSANVQLGEGVVAIGFALGLQGDPSVSNGLISALQRNVSAPWPYLQHTAPINHGSSGGPLLDLSGHVIGINTLLDENAQSVYFAIPADQAKAKAAELIAAMP